MYFCCAACGILVPQPGIESSPPALEAQSLNHWTTREVPIFLSFRLSCSSTISGKDFPVYLGLSQCLEWSFYMCQITSLLFRSPSVVSHLGAKAKIGPIKILHEPETGFHPDLISLHSSPHCSFIHSLPNTLTSLLVFQSCQTHFHVRGSGQKALLWYLHDSFLCFPQCYLLVEAFITLKFQHPPELPIPFPV